MVRLALFTLISLAFPLLALGQDLNPVGPGDFRLPPIDQPAPANETTPPPSATTDQPPVDYSFSPTDEESWWMIPSSWYKPLEGSAELGLNGTDGNSQTFNIRAGTKAKYTLPWVEQTLEFIHIDNSSDGVKTALNGYFDARLVFPFGESPWSFFVHKRIEYDQFRDYDLRLSGDAGLAYDLWKNDAGKFQLRSGLSGSQEMGGVDEDFIPELTFGLDLSHKFGEVHKISLVSDYYPAMENLQSDYRINTTASWEIIVCKAWGLSAKLSAIDRYDSTPQSRRPNDINYAALMLWSF